MKICLNTMLMLAFFYCLPAFSSALEKAQVDNEIRLVNFAERLVISEQARALSRSVREFKENCVQACGDNSAVELGIGLIGLSKGDAGTAALINLLGVRLDGAGAEERTCQILNRGSEISGPLEWLNTSNVLSNCRDIFTDLRKRELRQVADVSVERVCLTESELRVSRDELVEATKMNRLCEQ